MTESNDSKEKRLEKVFQEKRKKPYMKPNLREFGHIEKLTKGAATGPADSTFQKIHRP